MVLIILKNTKYYNKILKAYDTIKNSSVPEAAGTALETVRLCFYCQNSL